MAIKPIEVPAAQIQGTEQFIDAHKALFASVQQLFAPYLGKHRAITGNYFRVVDKLREAGFWVNDALNMANHPEMFREDEPASQEQEIPGADGKG